MIERTAAQLKRLIKRLGFEEDWYLIVLGAGIGVVTAIGAVGFITALEWLEHEVAHVQAGWVVWTLPLIPMAGALLTGLLVYFFAAAARGHGVPQVMHAIIRGHGVIPARVGVVKTLASICTVGSGGSAGAEGPIVQIGSTVGSYIGQKLRIPRQHLTTLVGCGAAAGIASVFNAPIAGVFFVLEILLRDFSMRTFAPIVIASVLSAATTRSITLENTPLFEFTPENGGYEFSLLELPSYVLLGFVCAAASVLFSRVLHFGEDMYEKFRIHPILKPVSGALLLGLLGIVFVLFERAAGQTAEYPQFFGNGYATILELIDPDSYIAGETGAKITSAVWLLGLLAVFKMVGTTATLASGGSGGVFAPSLFMGAAIGAAFGVGLQALGLPGSENPAPYALVGMAALIAGTTFAPLTAILMLLELTQEPLVLLPVMLASMIATVAARVWMRDSIYTMKLRQAGVMIGTGRDLTVLRKIPVTSVHLTPLPDEPVYASDPLSKLVTLHANHRVPDFAVVDGSGHYLGMVTGADMRTALIDREAIPLLLVAELVREDIPTLELAESLDTVMDKFAQADVSSLCLVSGAGDPMGLITRADVMKRYYQVLDES